MNKLNRVTLIVSLICCVCCLAACIVMASWANDASFYWYALFFLLGTLWLGVNVWRSRKD
ncbi:MAG: hypothetical protein K5778_04270 [Bacteroidaceae bacterium]|nr:hypothetical protein [Bacteroidaceae bacterium]MDO4994274.1 hypothetical protein [Bacteroidales bacterium]